MSSTSSDGTEEGGDGTPKMADQAVIPAVWQLKLKTEHRGESDSSEDGQPENPAKNRTPTMKQVQASQRLQDSKTRTDAKFEKRSALDSFERPLQIKQILTDRPRDEGFETNRPLLKNMDNQDDQIIQGIVGVHPEKPILEVPEEPLDN